MVTVSTQAGFQQEVVEAKEPVLVLFTADWCPFCRRFDPVFDALAAGFRGRVVRAHLEDEENPMWEEHHVDVVPTVEVFRDGRSVARHDGILGRGILRGDLERFLASVKA